MISKPFKSTKTAIFGTRPRHICLTVCWSFIVLADFSLTYNKFYHYVVHFMTFYGFQLYFSIDLQIFSLLTRHLNVLRNNPFMFD